MIVKKKTLKLWKKQRLSFLIGLFMLIFLSAVSIAAFGTDKEISSVHTIAKKAYGQIATPSAMPLPSSTQSSGQAMSTPSALPTVHYSGYCLDIPVLLYHHVQPTANAIAHGQGSLSVDPAAFDEQMAYLSTKYVSISAQQLVDALRNHTSLPSNAIVVTLDDAYLDVYQYAYPILQKYHVSASLMVPTGLLGGVGNNSYFTWDQLKQMVGSGLIYAYDHTWSHYPVGSGSPDKDQFEIMTAKQQLESNLGRPVTIFTNPYGTGANNPRVVQELEQDGFTGAYSTIPGHYQCDSFIYSLHRTHIGNAPLSAYGF